MNIDCYQALFPVFNSFKILNHSECDCSQLRDEDTAMRKTEEASKWQKPGRGPKQSNFEVRVFHSCYITASPIIDTLSQ